MGMSSQARWEAPQIPPWAGSLSTRLQGAIGPVTTSAQRKGKNQVQTAIRPSHISSPPWNQAPDEELDRPQVHVEVSRENTRNINQSMFSGLLYNLSIIWLLKQSDKCTWSKSLPCAHCGFPDNMRELWSGPWTHRQPLVATKTILFLELPSCLILL